VLTNLARFRETLARTPGLGFALLRTIASGIGRNASCMDSFAG
jgi:hypothetical protein